MTSTDYVRGFAPAGSCMPASGSKGYLSDRATCTAGADPSKDAPVVTTVEYTDAACGTVLRTTSYSTGCSEGSRAGCRLSGTWANDNFVAVNASPASATAVLNVVLVAALVIAALVCM